MWNSKTATVLFHAKVAACVKESDRLTPYENDFIEKLINSYKHRDASIALGLDSWEPTVKQLNFLDSLAGKVGFR